MFFRASAVRCVSSLLAPRAGVREIRIRTIGVPVSDSVSGSNLGSSAALPSRRDRRRLFHTHSDLADDAKDVHLQFKSLKDDTTIDVVAKEGMTLLEVAHKNKIDLEGACEGSVACSTCHVVLEDDIFDELPEATEDEDDMLDMAFGLTPTSRLGCQVIVTEDMDGTAITLPEATRNFYVDGHVPTPH